MKITDTILQYLLDASAPRAVFYGDEIAFTCPYCGYNFGGGQGAFLKKRCSECGATFDKPQPVRIKTAEEPGKFYKVPGRGKVFKMPGGKKMLHMPGKGESVMTDPIEQAIDMLVEEDTSYKLLAVTDEGLWPPSVPQYKSSGSLSHILAQAGKIPGVSSSKVDLLSRKIAATGQGAITLLTVDSSTGTIFIGVGKEPVKDEVLFSPILAMWKYNKE